MKPKKVFVLLLVVLLSSTFYLCFPSHAQTQTTLADTINNVLSGINLNNVSPEWGSIYSQIFGLTNQSIFDTLIQRAVSQSDWQDAIWVARLAELNGYNSQVINSSVKLALQNQLMDDALPASLPTWLVYSVYDRYMINAYRYAEELGVPGWNITDAFCQFADAYLASRAQDGTDGAMLALTQPPIDYGRYFDEYAETLGVFLEFALNGLSLNYTIDLSSGPWNAATDSFENSMMNDYGYADSVNVTVTNFMDDVWNNVQSHWGLGVYGYQAPDGTVECEMGNFAMLIAEYQNYLGALPYFDRVISDLQDKLLVNGWASGGWGGNVGVLQHADGNPQLRLEETLAALSCLQTFYQNFTSGNQANWQTMLPQAWQGLIGSSVYSNGQFQFTADSPSDSSPNTYSDDASLLGAMILFLYGIVPHTGSLAVNMSNELYEDYQTCFPVNQWQFNYQNRTIRIPVNAGTLGFMFGGQEVTENFPLSGVYQVQFSNDWNSIVSVTEISSLEPLSLQPATLAVLPPLGYTPPADITPPTNPSQPTPTPKASTTSTPTPTPHPTSQPQHSTPPTPSSTSPPTLSTFPTLSYSIVAIAAVCVGAMTTMLALKKRNGGFLKSQKR